MWEARSKVRNWSVVKTNYVCILNVHSIFIFFTTNQIHKFFVYKMHKIQWEKKILSKYNRFYLIIIISFADDVIAEMLFYMKILVKLQFDFISNLFNFPTMIWLLLHNICVNIFMVLIKYSMLPKSYVV